MGRIYKSLTGVFTFFYRRPYWKSSKITSTAVRTPIMVFCENCFTRSPITFMKYRYVLKERFFSFYLYVYNTYIQKKNNKNYRKKSILIREVFICFRSTISIITAYTGLPAEEYMRNKYRYIIRNIFTASPNNFCSANNSIRFISFISVLRVQY